MKIKHDKPIIPWRIKDLEAHGLIRAHNIRLGQSRVHAKVLVFDCLKNYRKFFDEPGGKLHKGSAACVKYCSMEHISFNGGKESKPTRLVEPRFFCMMGFTAGHIDLNTIAHECVHAAEAFSERFPNRKWPNQEGCPIEAICYPAGILTQYLFETLAEFITPPKGWRKSTPSRA